jgi:mannose-1-phosphate guanylyltransferase/CheY-like chemotaxis protein
MRSDLRPAQQSASDPRCALIVRGDAGTADVARAALAGEGFPSVVECQGTDMISAVERVGGFDLVVVDSAADGAEALDLVAYLRHRLPATPILFLAAAGAGLLAAAARDRGATGCLLKPLETTSTVAAVRALMEWRSPAYSEPGVVGDGLLPVPAGRVCPERDRAPLWAVVLAGGEGRRLRPLVRHIHGEERPKQYATLVGARSLLGRTLDRTSLLVAAERTVVVTVRRHRRYLADALAGRTVPVLAQPGDRGTAAGIMLPVHWIMQRDPDATVALFPSDHFVAEDRRFMAHVADVAAFVETDPARVVLVGVEATEPETEYGWIAPAEPLARIGATTVSRVARFIEKPPARIARACLEAGALWNTFVVIARASALADATHQLLPHVHDTLQPVVPLLGTARGVAALRRAYAALPPASFSSAVLERCGPALAVSRLTGATWCDWGSPQRVVRSLQHLGWRPAWLDTFAAGRPA